MKLKPSQWLEELDDALDYRKEKGRERDWEDLEKMFYSNSGKLADSGPNLIAAHGDSMLASLRIPSPAYTIRSKEPNAFNKARVLESLDNSLLEDLMIPETIDVQVLHAFLFGVGITKVGFDSEYGYDEKFDLGRADPRLQGMTNTRLSLKGEMIEFNSGKAGMPWLMNVHPSDFIVPWGASYDIESAPWVAHRLFRHIEDIRADPKYKTRGKLLTPTHSAKDISQCYSRMAKPSRYIKDFPISLGETKQEYIELYEIWCKRTQYVYTIAVNHDKFLREIENPYPGLGYPFVTLAFNPRTRFFWTTPDAAYLKTHQQEASDITIQATKQRRAAILKFLVDQDAITKENLEALTSAAVAPVIPLETKGKPISEAVFKLEGFAFNQSIYQDLEMVRKNSREQVGFSRNQMGEFDTGTRRSATEASIVDRSAQMRMSRRQELVQKAYIDSIKKINEILFLYGRSPRIVNLVGQDGAQLWPVINGPMLKGNYQYKINLSPAPELSKKERQQQALGVMQLFMAQGYPLTKELLNYLSAAYNDPELSTVIASLGNGQGMSQSLLQQGRGTR